MTIYREIKTIISLILRGFNTLELIPQIKLFCICYSYSEVVEFIKQTQCFLIIKHGVNSVVF